MTGVRICSVWDVSVFAYAHKDGAGGRGLQTKLGFRRAVMAEGQAAGGRGNEGAPCVRCVRDDCQEPRMPGWVFQFEPKQQRVCTSRISGGQRHRADDRQTDAAFCGMRMFIHARPSLRMDAKTICALIIA